MNKKAPHFCSGFFTASAAPFSRVVQELFRHRTNGLILHVAQSQGKLKNTFFCVLEGCSSDARNHVLPGVDLFLLRFCIFFFFLVGEKSACPIFSCIMNHFKAF